MYLCTDYMISLSYKFHSHSSSWSLVRPITVTWMLNTKRIFVSDILVYIVSKIKLVRDKDFFKDLLCHAVAWRYSEAFTAVWVLRFRSSSCRPKFRRNIFWRLTQHVPPKRWSTTRGLYGLTTQKTTIYSGESVAEKVNSKGWSCAILRH
jgi:hypothetical protein